MLRLNNRIFGILLFSTIFICACSWFSKGKQVLDLTTQITMTIELEEKSSNPEYRQIITLEKEDYWLTLDDDTRTPSIDIYMDELLLEGKEVPMIFIYDLFLGWAIIKEETLEIHKDFSELPKEQALLTKLMMMENPDVHFDGEKFISK